MAQPDFKVDGLQIEPGSAGTRRIQRASDGSLVFKDPDNSAGLTLSQLAGLQSFANVFVVGPAAPAEYTSIQDALDDVPASSSATNPSLILVMAGVYTETVNIVRDGVYLVGLGGVWIRSEVEDTPNGVGEYHTIVVHADLGTVPKEVVLQNLYVSNAHDGRACVRIVGVDGTELGLTSIQLKDCTLNAVAAGGNYQVWATCLNTLKVEGGDYTALVDSDSLFLLQEVATFEAKGVSNMGAVQVRSDSTEDQPSEVGLGYTFSSCRIGAGSGLSPKLSVTLEGISSLRLTECDIEGALAIAGDRDIDFKRCHIAGNTTISDTATVTLTGCTRAGTINTNATAVLREDRQTGTAAFVAVATVAVSFAIPHPDTSYFVAFELDSRPVNDETPWITNKLVTGFTINFNTAQTLNAGWEVRR